MSESKQTISHNNSYCLSESKDYVYMIFPNKAFIWNSHDFTTVHEIKHNNICTDTDAYEIENQIVFRFDNAEYRFDQATKQLSLGISGVVFRNNLEGLCIMRGNDIIHIFGTDVILKRRTNNAFYCIRAANGNYVLEMFRHDLDDIDNVMFIRKKIAPTNGKPANAESFELIIDKSTLSVMTLINNVARFYKMDTLELLDTIDDVHALSNKYAIVRNGEFDEIYGIRTNTDIYSFNKAHLNARFHFCGEILFCSYEHEPGGLFMFDIAKSDLRVFRFEGAYQLCHDTSYLPKDQQLLWHINGVFRKKNIAR